MFPFNKSMVFESILFYLSRCSHEQFSAFFTGSSGLTFTVGELPGSLASIGKSPNDFSHFSFLQT